MKKTISIELTKSEAMWILEKATGEALRGKSAIAMLESINADGKDNELLEIARETVSMITDLGLKIGNALKDELEKRIEEAKDSE